MALDLVCCMMTGSSPQTCREDMREASFEVQGRPCRRCLTAHQRSIKNSTRNITSSKTSSTQECHDFANLPRIVGITPIVRLSFNGLAFRRRSMRSTYAIRSSLDSSPSILHNYKTSLYPTVRPRCWVEGANRFDRCKSNLGSTLTGRCNQIR